MRMIALLPCLALALAAAACGGATPPPQEPEPVASPEVAAEPEAEPPKAPAPSPAPTPEPDDHEPESWQPARSDCEILASRYERLLHKREMDALEQKKLAPKIKEAARADVERVVREGAENWMSACEQIVGSTQPRQYWDCARHAKSVDEFHSCMNVQPAR